MTEPYGATPPPTGGPDKDARLWATFAHLSALAGWILAGLVFLGPLIVWLIKREEMPFVNDQGKEALNFNITVTIAAVVLAIVSVVSCGIGSLLFIPLGLYHLIFVIIATIKANGGETYRYPATLRLIK